MFLRQIFNPYLAQYAYLVGCPRSGEPLIIDPERDIDRYRAIALENGVTITAVAETHIHADFVSCAQEFAADPGICLYLSGEGGSGSSGVCWPSVSLASRITSRFFLAMARDAPAASRWEPCRPARWDTNDVSMHFEYST